MGTIYLQSKDDQYFRPDTCVVGLCIHIESLECSEDNEGGDPATPERGRGMKNLLPHDCSEWYLVTKQQR